MRSTSSNLPQLLGLTHLYVCCTINARLFLYITIKGEKKNGILNTEHDNDNNNLFVT